MFERVALKGERGSISWGYAPAAELLHWTAIRKTSGARTWTLTAQLYRPPDSLRLKQTPLLFLAPRRQKPVGMWTFPVISIEVRGSTLRAQLGPPEGR